MAWGKTGRITGNQLKEATGGGEQILTIQSTKTGRGMVLCRYYFV